MIDRPFVTANYGDGARIVRWLEQQHGQDGRLSGLKETDRKVLRAGGREGEPIST